MALQRALDQALVGECRPRGYFPDHPGACAEISELLSLGANPNARERTVGGRSALSMAADEGYYPIVKLLVDHKADVNQADDRPLNRCIGKHLWVHQDVAALLLHHGAEFGVDSRGIDWTASNKRYPTALHKAAYMGWYKAFRILLERGHDPTVLNDDGKTPAQCAHDVPRFERLVEVSSVAMPDAMPDGADLWIQEHELWEEENDRARLLAAMAVTHSRLGEGSRASRLPPELWRKIVEEGAPTRAAAAFGTDPSRPAAD